MSDRARLLGTRLSRRRLVAVAGGAIAGAWAGPIARVAGAASGPDPQPEPQRDPEARLAEIADAARAVGEARLDGEGWRAQVEAALAGVDAQGLRACIAVDAAAVRAGLGGRGYASRALDLDAGELRGFAPGLAHARAKLFALDRDRAVLPHAHRHIVSVFVVLEGRVRARHYDRVRDEPGAIVIRPSDDRELGPADFAAISELRDNVHWLTATRDASLLLNLSVSLAPALRREPGPAGRVYLDPAGEVVGEGLIRAPRVSLAELRQRYGTSPQRA